MCYEEDYWNSRISHRNRYVVDDDDKQQASRTYHSRSIAFCGVSVRLRRLRGAFDD